MSVQEAGARGGAALPLVGESDRRVPVQLPGLPDSTCPSRSVPVKVGSAVFWGEIASMTPLRSEDAVVVSEAFSERVAVSWRRTRLPTSAAVRV